MFTTALAIVGLFALRLGVPIVFTFLLSEALRRLDIRWSDMRGLAA